MRISMFGWVGGGHCVNDAADTLIYRLRHWPDLPDSLHRADVLRTLSVMSSRPVNRAWMLRSSKLPAETIDHLLQLLATRGDLEVVNTSGFPAEGH